MALPRYFLKCQMPGCESHVNTRMFNYLWIGWVWRGRGAVQSRDLKQLVLCPEHGRLVQDALVKVLEGRGAFCVVLDRSAGL